MLDKQESFKELFRKRILKYIIIIIVFGFIQYLNSYFQNREIGLNFNITTKILYSSNIITAYWFYIRIWYLCFIVIFDLSVKKSDR